MRLARVIYTRVETRLNPDYQVLGFSPTAAALVSSRALDGFFHGLLGQPDTLTGFERACLFAPLFAPAGPASTGTVWVAGLARASDKPDRHGRTGILNFSVLLLTEEQAAALSFNPWPLFEPVLSERAFPFIDDPEARVADFEYTPHGQATAREGGEASSPYQRPPQVHESLTHVLEAVRSNRCVLIRARSPRTPARDLEAALREVHTALPPEERVRVPFLTHSFRPGTSAARLKLLAAPAHSPQAEEDWRRVVERYTPGAGATDASAPLEVWRQSTAAALQAAAALAAATPEAEPQRTPVHVPRPAPNDRRRLSKNAWRSGRVLLAVLALGVGVALASWLLEPVPPDGAPNGNAEKPAVSQNSEPSDRPSGTAGEPPGDPVPDPADDTPPGPAPPPEATSLSSETQAALDKFHARWRATGLWGGRNGDASAREEFERFLEPFRKWLHESAPPEATKWPPKLRRFATEVALTGWRLDGRAASDLAVSYRLVLELTLPADYAVHPIRMDYVLPGAVLPSRHWRLTKPLTVQMPPEELPAPHLSFGPGETGGELRVRALVHPPASKQVAAEQPPQPVEVAGRSEVPNVDAVLAADSPLRIPLSDAHGGVAMTLALERFYVEPTEATRRAGFPDASIPVYRD